MHSTGIGRERFFLVCYCAFAVIIVVEFLLALAMPNKLDEANRMELKQEHNQLIRWIISTLESADYYYEW